MYKVLLYDKHLFNEINYRYWEMKVNSNHLSFKKCKLMDFYAVIINKFKNIGFIKSMDYALEQEEMIRDLLSKTTCPVIQEFLEDALDRIAFYKKYVAAYDNLSNLDYNRLFREGCKSLIDKLSLLKFALAFDYREANFSKLNAYIKSIQIFLDAANFKALGVKKDYERAYSDVISKYGCLINEIESKYPSFLKGRYCAIPSISNFYVISAMIRELDWYIEIRRKTYGYWKFNNECRFCSIIESIKTDVVMYIDKMYDEIRELEKSPYLDKPKESE